MVGSNLCKAKHFAPEAMRQLYFTFVLKRNTTTSLWKLANNRSTGCLMCSKLFSMVSISEVSIGDTT